MDDSREDDWELLRQYVRDGSQAAFARLVQLHIRQVYSACRRQLRDAQRAEDATQATFMILARKASSLVSSQRLRPRGSPLPLWLHKTARYVSLNAMRADAARRRHEQRGAAMRPDAVYADDPAAVADALAPVLDTA